MSGSAANDPTPHVLRTLGIAAAATVGGVGASRGVYELLAAQARIARRVIPKPTTWPFNGDGLYHPGSPGPERWRPGMHADYEVMIFGDSTAAGLGASSREELPGVLIAKGLAEESGRSVRLSTKAIVGATSKSLWSQIEAMQITGGKPDLSIILVGGNDITALNGIGESARRVGQAVQVLVDSGSRVVVGTCPDLGIIRPVPQPLRSVMRAWSLRLAAMQAAQTRAAGGVPVSMAKYMTSEFLSRPDHFFAADQFHPNSAGYELAAAILLPPALISLGVWSEDRAEEADSVAEAEAREEGITLDAPLRIRERRVFEEGAIPEVPVDIEGGAPADAAEDAAVSGPSAARAGAESGEKASGEKGSGAEAHANNGAVVQQLMWRLVHVLRPGDTSSASEHRAGDSPFESDVFAHERAVYLDDPDERGTSDVTTGPSSSPGRDGREKAEAKGGEARSAAARFFRLSRFRPPALPRLRGGDAGGDSASADGDAGSHSTAGKGDAGHDEIDGATDDADAR